MISLLTGPYHGWLEEIDPLSGSSVSKNITTFSTNDLLMGKVMYQHDNTENRYAPCPSEICWEGAGDVLGGVGISVCPHVRGINVY